MAAISIKKDQFLFHDGDSVNEVYLILTGSFSVSFPGGSYTLSKGEVIGICELTNTSHITACRALADASVLVYPVSDITSLETLFRESPDYCMVFTRSAMRQMNTLLQIHDLERINADSLYHNCTQDYSLYLASCLRNQIKPRTLPEMAALSPHSEDLPLEYWASSYYDGFLQLLSGNGSSFLAREPAVPTGLIATVCMDSVKVLSSLNMLADYQKQVLSFYLNNRLEDLLDFFTELYLKLDSASSDATSLYAAITHMTLQIESSPYVEHAAFKQRIADFKSCLKAQFPEEKIQTQIPPASCLKQLNGSIQIILTYADMDDDFCTLFRNKINTYKKLSDKNAADDASRNLRHEITTMFYKLYSAVFFRAVKEISILPPVRMFLYFGYVDEQLAGLENSIYLYHLSDRLSKESHPHIYTLYDWLTAIYQGKKEPCRNDFDVDYTEHVRVLKVSKKINAAEEITLLADMKKRVEYELQNMVPSVNKMTFGRISSFCPVFSAHNLLKQPETSFVSSDSLETILKDILNLDFSAFYREYVYSNLPAGIPKEFFHMEVLPDIILSPIIGIRGVMWQEIEGRRRTTAARMMLPIFYLEDLQTAVTRLIGEYRWEMCKRVQGSRWNDISDRSLTSEYFDYIQFYRKNHELSVDAKEKLKTSLQKARGSFKEMFIRDYVTYIIYEGTGAPRLTRLARNILFTYCPFAKQTREALMGNPLYKEMLDQYMIRNNQQLHKINLLEKRVLNTGNCLPKELILERQFLEY